MKFEDFERMTENRTATLEDVREIGRKNALEQAGLFAKYCIGPDPSKLMKPSEWRRIYETDVLPKNLAKMRAGGWSEENIAAYLTALNAEIDAMLLNYAQYGLTGPRM